MSIPLNVPLKRKMKLKKNATEWSWINFEYEAVPTFCYICGLIGHSDRFCDKLFETQGDSIEKPYGSWMRADSKRRSYTMGSKWLRSGGATPVNNAEEKESDKLVSVNTAVLIRENVKSWIETDTSTYGALPAGSENHGVKGGI